jgi:hypothetical protein
LRRMPSPQSVLDVEIGALGALSARKRIYDFRA